MSDNPELPDFSPNNQSSRISQVRTYVYNTITNLIDAGLELTDIIAQYTQQGISLATREMTDIFNIFNQTYGDLFEVSQVPPNLPIPRYVMDIFNSTHDTEYRYIGEFVTFDEDTGERKEVRFFLDSNQILSRNIAADQMLDFFIEKYQAYENIAISSINIINVYRNF